MDEEALITRLKAIHRLRVGATTPGEAKAAAAAYERVARRLDRLRSQRPVRHKFSIHDPWARKLFFALLRKHGLRPYRLYRQHRTTVRVDAPRRFMDEVVWPEFLELQQELYGYLHEVTDRVIGQALQADGSAPSGVEQRGSVPG